MKQRIFFQVWVISPMPYDKIRRLRQARSFGKNAYVFQWRHLPWKEFAIDKEGNAFRQGMLLTEINTYAKFAKYLRYNFDVHALNPVYYAIKFYDEFKQNPSFSSSFVCTKPRCKYFLNTSCKTKWMSHRPGDTCKRNPRIALKNSRYHVYFIIKITKNDTIPNDYKWDLIDSIIDPVTGKVYIYPNYMHRFDWWFRDAEKRGA